MADNVTTDPGTGGAVFATDDIGGVHYPITKLAFGALDSQTIASSGNGNTDAGTIRVTVSADSTGVLSVDDNGASITVDNSGTFATQVDGAALTALQLIDNLVLAEDAAHASGDPGVQILGVRRDTAASSTVTDGDYATLNLSSTGRLWTSALLDTALPAGTNNIGDVDVLSIAAGDNNIGNVDIVTMPNVTLAAGTNTNEVVGDAAHDAAAAGNPVLVGAVASAAAPTDVTADGDAVRLWALRNGAQAVQPTLGGVLAVAGNGASGTGVQRVTIANDSTGVLATVSTVTTVTNITNQGQIADDAAFTAATTRVNMAGFFADETATDSVDEGDGGAARMTLDRKQIVTVYAHAAAGGATPYKNLDCDETEDEIKASAGKLFWITAVNLAATKRYIKFYNATAANVTVGTTTPVLTFPIPTMGDTNGAGFTLNFGDLGVQFDTAITVAATTGFADNDTGAPGANEVILNCAYL